MKKQQTAFAELFGKMVEVSESEIGLLIGGFSLMPSVDLSCSLNAGTVTNTTCPPSNGMCVPGCGSSKE